MYNKMLSFLSSRETGCDPPRTLYNAECTRRAYSLEISKSYDLQRIHGSGINTVDLDPTEERYLLSGGADGVIVIHDITNGTGVPQCTYPSVCSVGRSNKYRHKFSVQTVQWYPLDTGMFISSGFDKLLKVWDTNSLVTADEYEFNGMVYCHQMSSIATKHCLIAAASQSATVKLIDLKSGSATHTLKAHRKPVLTLAWSTRDEFLLATGSEDNRVLLWDIRSSKGSMMVLDQHNGDTTAGPHSTNTAHNGCVNGMCFTSDGLHLVTFGTDDRLRLWDTYTGRNTLVNFGKICNESKKSVHITVSSNCTPDLVYVPDDNDIEVKDLSSGADVATLRGHYAQINSCVWDHSSHHMYSCGNDRNILVWIPESDQEAVVAYEDHLRGDKEEVTKTTPFLRRVGATDAWSSDEDN